MKTKQILLPISLLFLIAALGTPAVQANDGEVARAIFTTEIEDREPTDTLESLPTDLERVHFFTDLRNFTDQKVTHRWYHNDLMLFELSFDVGGPRWRTWSSLALSETQTGTWKVEVVADGNVVQSVEIGR